MEMLIMFGLLTLAMETGRTLAQQNRQSDSGGDPGLVVSASLGLKALLLGFTASMAVAPV